MNKGRNIMLILCCLLVIGCLTFFARTKTRNSSEVVDNVRYVLKSAENDTKNYEFYFTDYVVMTGTVQMEKDKATIYLYVRGEYIEDLKEYETDEYDYYYVVTGTERDNADVAWYLDENSEISDKSAAKPYERFSEQVFVSMLFGTEPYISIPQAFIIGLLVLAGGAVILMAEELWHIIYRKPDYDTPAWHDMDGIKRVGVGILIFAAILLIVFIFM